MRKHQIENLVWREMVWQRPFEMETLWEALTHLSALSPRGAVILECRGSSGHVTHLLGADRIHIGRIEQVFRAHSDVRFRGVKNDCQRHLKMSIFAEMECRFLLGNIRVLYSLIHHITCRFEARQALIYQLVPGLTGENGKYNYSKAVHLYPPLFDIFCSAKNYKTAPALTTTPECLLRYLVSLKSRIQYCPSTQILSQQ